MAEVEVVKQMTYSEIVDRITNVINSCNNYDQLITAKEYCFMLSDKYCASDIFNDCSTEISNTSEISETPKTLTWHIVSFCKGKEISLKENMESNELS